ncbi:MULTISPECIES: hypothetical protein [unclassified Rhizobium]|uniref:hypothetical protein n=3 Tax=Hyphomicrobiales TaxID=356 RepID=UPI002604FAF0|nr:hypothetical protein [uncultured Rhizobium sp.]
MFRNSKNGSPIHFLDPLYPINDIPNDEIALLGEMMAWTAYIEVDLFTLYILGKPGSEVKRRKEFYKQTAGLKQRVRLVRETLHAKLHAELAGPFNALMTEVEILADVRNTWAHNPIIRFGPERTLVRWEIGSGEFAGRLVRVDAKVLRPLMPRVEQLHLNLRNLAALVNSPTGEQFAITFGERDARMDAQLKRLLAASRPKDP